MRKIVVVIVAIAYGCGGGDGDDGVDPGPRYPQSCRSEIDYHIDNDIDTTVHYALDRAGWWTEMHVFEGTSFDHRTNLVRDDGNPVEETLTDRTGVHGVWTYTWSGDDVTSGSFDGVEGWNAQPWMGPDGTDDITSTWEYDAGGRLSRYVEQRTTPEPLLVTSMFSYDGDDECYDRVDVEYVGLNPTRSNRRTYINREDCEPIEVAYDFDTDGSIEYTMTYAYDASGHVTRIDRSERPGGMDSPYVWLYTWAGDQLQAIEGHLDDTLPSGQDFRQTNFYECPGGIPPY